MCKCLSASDLAQGECIKADTGPVRQPIRSCYYQCGPHWSKFCYKCQAAWITASLIPCLPSAWKLQSVQNSAARLLTQTGRREHITPVLTQLDFKLTVLMYQIWWGLAPTNLQDRCMLASEVSSGRQQHSANVPTFVVLRTRTKLRDRSLLQADQDYGTVCQGLLTLATFKRLLKTFLFSD